MVKGVLPVLLALFAAMPLGAQDGSPRLDLIVPPRVQARIDAPTTAISGVLTEGHRRELLNSGWSTAIHAHVELWKKGGLFGLSFDRESVLEWDIVLDFAPATKIYQVR